MDFKVINERLENLLSDTCIYKTNMTEEHDGWSEFMDKYFEEDNLDLDCNTAQDGDKVAVWLFTKYTLPKSVVKQIQGVDYLSNVEFDNKLDELTMELNVNPGSSEEEINNALSALRQVNDILKDFDTNGDPNQGDADEIIENLDFEVTEDKMEDSKYGSLRLHDNSSGLDFWVDVEILDNGDFQADWNQYIYSDFDDDRVRKIVHENDYAFECMDSAVYSYLLEKGYPIK